MLKRLIVLSLWIGAWVAVPRCPAVEDTSVLEIYSAEVNGKTIPCQAGKEVNLGAFPAHVVFKFGVASNAVRVPSRVWARLDGVDEQWRTGGGEMFLTIWFSNEAGDRVNEKGFMVVGESTGWTGTLNNSTLAHRRETLTAPPDATRIWVVISSAGPPSTTGIYVVDDLTVSRISTNGGKSEVLLSSPFGTDSEGRLETQAPEGWRRDGVHPSMAKIVEIGQDPKKRALAIVDEDRYAHAEWHTRREDAPRISPNDKLVVEWNEMFSIGEIDNKSASYNNLAPGVYHLRVAEATLFGKPTGLESTLKVRVPLVIWKEPWFWALVAVAAVGSSAMSARYITRQRLQRAMYQLEQQRALEAERLRIARDIHDDWGARVTQIALLSDMAQNDLTVSEKTMGRLHRISVMSRDLVSALYETVWSVNPENDNIDAMVNYLCERLNEFCDQAQLRCRLHVSELPKGSGVSSRARHNVSMAVGEAMNNVIKHANASQVTVHIDFVDSELTVSIQDDGRGFLIDSASLGNGLANMKGRMDDIGGTCQIESNPGNGTTIRLRLRLESSQNDAPANPSSA